MYILLLAHIGKEPLAVTTNCSIDFLRKPNANEEIIADCKLIKLGNTLVFGEVAIKQSVREVLLAKSSITYFRPKGYRPKYSYGLVLAGGDKGAAPFVEACFIFEVSGDKISPLLFLTFWVNGSSCLCTDPSK
jgi:hypothetical protein